MGKKPAATPDGWTWLDWTLEVVIGVTLLATAVLLAGLLVAAAFVFNTRR